MIKLSEWAKRNKYSYTGAYSLFKQGRLPVKCVQLPSGTILVEEDCKTSCKVIDNKSKKSFTIEIDVDLNNSGFSGEDQKDILDEINSLAAVLALKLKFGEKTIHWIP